MDAVIHSSVAVCALAVGPSVRATKQRGERLQPGPDHLPGSGRALRLHQGSPEAHSAGHDCKGEEGRGCRQVRCL